MRRIATKFICARCVRIPTLRAHAEAITIDDMPVEQVGSIGEDELVLVEGPPNFLKDGESSFNYADADAASSALVVSSPAKSSMAHASSSAQPSAPGVSPHGRSSALDADSDAAPSGSGASSSSALDAIPSALSSTFGVAATASLIETGARTGTSGGRRLLLRWTV